MKMIKFFSFLFFSVFLCAALSAQPVQKGATAESALTSAGPETGTFTRISQHKDYALTVTRLVVDLGEGAAVTMKELPEGSFEVVGTNKTEKVARNIRALSVTDKKGEAVDSSRYVTIDLDFGFDSDADNAFTYVVTLKRDLGKFTKGAEFLQKGHILRK
jgi:hypothetical protein